MKRTLSITAAMLPLTLAACATPETRVRTALLDAGVSRPVATCMAGRMVDRLSIAQLQKLARLGGGQQLAGMSATDLVRRVGEVGDPEIIAVVTSAGLGCAIAS